MFDQWSRTDAGPLALGGPLLEVDTTQPVDIDAIAAWVRAARLTRPRLATDRDHSGRRLSTHLSAGSVGVAAGEQVEGVGHDRSITSRPSIAPLDDAGQVADQRAAARAGDRPRQHAEAAAAGVARTPDRLDDAGASRSITARVPSGVRSRGRSPYRRW